MTRSSFLESISEKDEEEMVDSLNQDPIEQAKKDFKIEMVQIKNPTLNAILDHDQQRLLYKIKIGKARKKVIKRGRRSRVSQNPLAL